MADTAPAPSPLAPPGPPLQAGAGRWGDPIFKAVSFSAGALVLVILAAIAFVTFNKSWSIWTSQPFSFIFKTGFGKDEPFHAGGLIIGTLVTSFIAVLLAVPIAVGCALFLTEICPRSLKRPLSSLIELLAAVPSVIYGLWGIKVLAPFLYNYVEKPLNDLAPGLFVRGVLTVSGSYFLGGVVLAIMILPIIAAISREVFRQVPEANREAALALGATKWETIRYSVLPYARSGIVGAVVIGLGRALGETIALALTLGAVENPSFRIFSPGDSLPARIANSYGEATGSFQGALIGLAAILLIITVLVNVVARRFVRALPLAGRLMTADLAAVDGLAMAEPPGLLDPTSRRRRTKDLLARIFMIGSVLVAVIPLALVLIYVTRRGLHVMSWSYLTKDHFAKIVCAPGGSPCSGGIAPDIVGTLIVVGVATLFAAPLGLMAAIYLNEYGTGRLARTVRFFTDVMTGVPSIIAGIFVFSIIVIATDKVAYNGLAGGCALAVLMLPLIIRACEEMLRLVPASLREASFALGIPRWRTILRVVLPNAASGITTSIMLAVARATGETAPLLFTLFGGQNRIRTTLFGKNDAIPIHIFTNTNRPETAFVDSAWGAALTLIVITLLLTVAARVLTARKGTPSVR